MKAKRKALKRTGKPGALILMSGGLDSILAARLVQEQGVRVEAIHFTDPFSDSIEDSRKACKSLGIRLHEVSRSRSLIGSVRSPGHGYGSQANPCIDCRILSLRKAWAFARKRGLDFLVTGEVVGQRPMSQKKPEIMLIEKRAGVRGRVLRPLSAKLLPETMPEKNGWVDRSRLLGISGRSRKEQMAIARRYGIRDYPSPAGGCLLTDPVYARRVFDMLCHEKPTEAGFRLLKFGRHFRKGGSRIVVGRDEKENTELGRIARRIYPRPVSMEAVNHAGPLTLVINPTRKSLRTAASLTVRYSDAGGREEVEIKQGRKRKRLSAVPASQKDIITLRI